jgi:transketolase
VKKILNSAGETVECADPRAVRTCLALMNLGAVNGGAACHWGGPSAMVETMSALHQILFQQEDWFEHYHFVNDIGHGENGIYALRALLGFGGLQLEDLKGFRSIDSYLTGHGESHLYPQGVLLSNGPLSSALAQAQGLALGDFIQQKQRTTIAVVSDGASMEGEAKEAFAAIAGFGQKKSINPFLLIMSDNNTKLSGKIDQDSFSMQPSFEIMANLGWHMIKIDNGHDLEQVYHGLEQAFDQLRKDPFKPVFFWVKTVKGQGVQKTMDHPTGGHGFPLKAFDDQIFAFIQEIWNNQCPQEFLDWAHQLTEKPETKKADKELTPKGKVQLGISKAAVEKRKQGLPVISLSSDLQGSTGMAGFHKEYPQFSLDVGIAESNMISSAAGCSKVGLIPIVDTFAAFGITKGNLPLIMSSLSGCPIIGVFSHTGFQDAADGASHQSLTYFSAISAIPKTNIIALATAQEAEAYLGQAIERIDSTRKKGEVAESVIFFLGRENFPLELEQNLNWGQDSVLIQGEDCVVAATGPLLFHALEAAKRLKAEGLAPTIINHRFLNQIDLTLYQEQLNKNKGRLLTVEDHQLNGGIGSYLTHQLSLSYSRSTISVKSLGVQGTFGQSAYLADHLYAKHELDSEGIYRAIKELCLAN